ncbi:MAG: cell wall-binding repeat-containing protein [Coriobacteriia bacterium]
MNRRLRPLVSSCALLAATIALTLPALPAHAAHIFIDPGHGGIYSNANLASLGIYEKNVNLQMALRLRAELVRRGHTVSMSRTTDVAVGLTDRPTWKYTDATDKWTWVADGITRYADGVPRDDLQARCDLANAAGADLFVSVHNNGDASTLASGYETFSAAAEDRLGALLAGYVHDAVIDATPLRDRGAKSTAFYVIKWSHMPAILIEGGFLTNAADRAYVTSASGQTTIAYAMADGIEEFLASDPYRQLWPRLAGDTRYGTAAALSLDGWPDGAQTVLLATGEDWPDALASAPLAGTLDAPLLLSAPATLPVETAGELARLKPERIIVLGGTGALSSEVASAAAVAAGLTPDDVTRIGGLDRYETSARIADEVGVPEDGRVCVATGSSPADAVSISAYAGANEIPILLVDRSAIPTATADFAEANADTWRSTLIVGGTTAIPDAVVASLPDRTRYAGIDRYATNAAVLERLYNSGSIFYVVNGEAYPDCLTAGVRGAKNSGAIMLVRPRTLGDHQRLYIENHESLIWAIRMVGGTDVLPRIHEWMIDKALR